MNTIEESRWARPERKIGQYRELKLEADKEAQVPRVEDFFGILSLHQILILGYR